MKCHARITPAAILRQQRFSIQRGRKILRESDPDRARYCAEQTTNGSVMLSFFAGTYLASCPGNLCANPAVARVAACRAAPGFEFPKTEKRSFR